MDRTRRILAMVGIPVNINKQNNMDIPARVNSGVSEQNDVHLDSFDKSDSYNCKKKAECETAAVIHLQQDTAITSTNMPTQDDDTISLASSIDDSLADPDFLPSEDECQEENLCNDGSPEITSSSDTSLGGNVSNAVKENSGRITSPKIKIISDVFVRPFLKDVQNNKKVRQRDFCYFCEVLVSNFARHLQRCHHGEIEVQRILSLPAKNQERKILINNIRKKGNYLKSNSECFKPMRRPILPEDVNTYRACEYCLGFYSHKQLWRHKKRCPEKPSSGKGRNLLNNMSYPKVDVELREKVFPTMRRDKISLVAQKDVLICAYAARYMKTHRDKHFISVTSRKMRELARLLIELRKCDKSIQNLFDSLQPKYYDNLVEATKMVAGYDYNKESFQSPTFAINIGTSLKQCCDVALVYALKRKDIYSTIPSAEAEANLKTLINLLTSNWKFDISSQAATILNIKKWNKITIVPLASDLKLLKEHLLLTASSAKLQLSCNNDCEKAYRTLVETVFCRVILLNRKRPGELQRLTLDAYNTSHSQNQNYEEFSDAISPAEKVLMQNFKRIVIRGKRGRGVPVLFSTDIQRDIEIMITLRPNYILEDNKYLFGTPHTKSHIYGYKVLAKYAFSCGAKNPDAVTCTRLRKHLATLTQVFNMTENDLEQLATFMGHTAGIHRQSYRLPDDVYQTAKIAKILLLMEQGTCAAFKGKSIDEIEVNLDENLLESNENEDTEVLSDSDADDSSPPGIDAEVLMSSNSQQSKSTASLRQEEHIIPSSQTDRKCENHETRRKKIERTPWTSKQKSVVESFFKNHILINKPPKKLECEKLKEIHPELLKNKNWLKIKVMVQNIYTKKLKQNDDDS